MSNPFREIYLEALKGGQHKIDVDKDGKIEGEDLAKLRAKKMKEELVSEKAKEKEEDDEMEDEEVEQQDEATYDYKKAMQSQNPRIQKKGIGGAMDNAAKRIQQTIKDVPLNSLEKRYKEEVEQIDEVEKATGGLKDACWKGYTAVGMKMKNGKKVPNCVPTKESTNIPFDGPYKKVSDTVTDKSGAKHSPMSRVKHLAQMAAKKKEDEAKKEVKEDVEEGYIPPVKPKLTPSDSKTLNKVAALMAKEKAAKTAKMKEEVEQIDELDKSTLGSYVKKASTNARINSMISKDFDHKAMTARKPSTRDAYYGLSSKYKQKSWKRSDNVAKAVDRLTKEEVEEIEEKSDQAKRNKTMKNLMAASKGAQINRGLKLDPTEYGYKRAQNLNVAIGRAAMKAEETQIEFTQEELQLIEQFIEIAEKMNMSKASMGDVIKDFKKSDAPQFAGKSMEKRRQMAIAAKLSADRETKKEETELVSFKGFSLDEIKMSDLPSRKVTGKYGTEYYKGEKDKDEKGYDADDDKESSTEKRGRGRPKGSASGARQKGSTPKKKGSGVEMTGYPLHLPNSR